MKGFAIFLVIVVLLGGLFFLTSPRKAVGPSAPGSGAAVSSSSPKTPDAVREKLMDYAGAGATDCGRLSVQATIDQSKTASDCATQANQGKHAFYVAYDMPGMAIGIAGNAAGKLFTVQSQGSGSSGALSSGDCPSQLRVASSGRVTCFAPGDMGSMAGSHAAGSMPSGMPNPHGSAASPHGTSKPQ
jgi:hypothetical protein